METKHIQISDYNYELPDERIAKFPKAERDTSKLLVYRHGEVREDVFRNLPDYLPQGALMVMNNTRVIKARLLGHKATGGAIEAMIVRRSSLSSSIVLMLSFWKNTATPFCRLVCISARLRVLLSKSFCWSLLSPPTTNRCSNRQSVVRGYAWWAT